MFISVYAYAYVCVCVSALVCVCVRAHSCVCVFVFAFVFAFVSINAPVSKSIHAFLCGYFCYYMCLSMCVFLIARPSLRVFFFNIPRERWGGLSVALGACLCVSYCPIQKQILTWKRSESFAIQPQAKNITSVGHITVKHLLKSISRRFISYQ